MPTTIKITFKRIQNFLFAVPRLKAMLGANVLLGETIRAELVSLVEQVHETQPNSVSRIDAHVEEYPLGKDSVPDPLTEAKPNAAYAIDNPNALYRLGIFSRDGGHFHVRFTNENAALQFIDVTHALIGRHLPGMAYEIESDDPALNIGPARSFGVHATRLPQFEVCQDTGTAPASKVKEGDPGQDNSFVSERVTRLEDAEKRFRSASGTLDIIGLLKPTLPLPNRDIAEDLDQLAGASGYVALLHADGNSVGHRLSQWRCDKQQEALPYKVKPDELEAHVESFFWAMRRALRRAVVDALNEVYTDQDQHNGPRPYQLLMLGGDDLLLLCRPDKVFPLAVALGNSIADYDLPDKKPLSLGMGVSITHKNVPFHLLADVAEELSASAKRLYRQQREERSVVDWNVATTSWVDSILEERRRLAMETNGSGRHYLRSERPCFVSDRLNGVDPRPTLEALLASAGKLEQLLKDEGGNRASRAKLKQSARTLYKDPDRAADFYTRFYAGERAGNNSRVHQVLEGCLQEGSPWRHIEGDYYSTSLLDLIELVEVVYLGRQNSGKGEGASQKELASG